MKVNRYILVPIILTLLGCATPYQPKGVTGGYEDKKVSENQYELAYQVNALTQKSMVETFWHKRASELCSGGKYEYKYTKVGAIRVSVVSSSSGYVPVAGFEHPRIEGIVICKAANKTQQDAP